MGEDGDIEGSSVSAKSFGLWTMLFTIISAF